MLIPVRVLWWMLPCLTIILWGSAVAARDPAAGWPTPPASDNPSADGRAANGGAAGPSPDDVARLVDSCNRFAVDLFRQLDRSTENICFSPASICSALTMTYGGAAGKTADEMRQVLYLSPSSERVHAGMAALLQAWRTAGGRDGLQLRLAHRLWADDQYALLPDFVALTRNHYGAPVVKIRFAQPEPARQEINAWVHQQTEGLIRQLLAEGQLAGDTRLVLTNACYFRGGWRYPFDERATGKQPFHISPSEERAVSMMVREAKLAYAKLDRLQILELPYAAEHLSMILILPQPRVELAELVGALTWDQLHSWLGAKRRATSVVVHLPRFQTAGRCELRAALQLLGMKTAFDPARADFSAITGARDLALAEVVHESVLNVDEAGTEAAAATAVLMEPTGDVEGSSPRPVAFRADRPFLFFVQDTKTGALLFAGRLVRPESGSRR